jgi:hypothetical protein
MNAQVMKEKTKQTNLLHKFIYLTASVTLPVVSVGKKLR